MVPHALRLARPQLYGLEQPQAGRAGAEGVMGVAGQEPAHTDAQLGLLIKDMVGLMALWVHSELWIDDRAVLSGARAIVLGAPLMANGRLPAGHPTIWVRTSCGLRLRLGRSKRFYHCAD
jgi:hypothetical protein